MISTEAPTLMPEIRFETPIHEYLDQPWLKANLPLNEREQLFEAWLHGLPEALLLEPKSPTDFIQTVILQRQELPMSWKTWQTRLRQSDSTRRHCRITMRQYRFAS